MFELYCGNIALGVKFDNVFGDDINELDILQAMEEAHEDGVLDVNLFPYGVYDVRIITSTEIEVEYEDHSDSFNTKNLTLKFAGE